MDSSEYKPVGIHNTGSVPRLVAAYYRVSTATQEENQTIETQISAVKDFAAKSEYTIIKEYRDDGWSGDTLIRPELDLLRVDARSKTRSWNAVLVYDPDRIARRYSYQELVMDELREAGIDVLFVTTPAPKNMEDKILHGVKGLFAEYERAKIAERFRLGKIRKVTEGHILTAEAKYGYTYVPKKDKVHGYYVINEEEAKVVRMIYHWVADEAMTVRGVVRRLHELQIMPRKSKRGVWSTSSISTLLRHKAYIGETHWGSSYGVVPQKPLKSDKYRKIKKSSRRRRPEEEWYVIPVPEIIERELYDRVRLRLTVNASQAKRNRKNEYLLAGRIWCVCGKRRCGSSPMGGKHLYYFCNSRIQSFPLQSACREKSVNARIADRLVWEKITDLMTKPELMLEQVEKWYANQSEQTDSFVADLADLKKERKKIKEHEDRYNRAYGAGLVSLEQLREYLAPLREKAKTLSTQMENKRRESGQVRNFIIPDREAMKAFAEHAAVKMTNLSFSTKQGIVSQTIYKVIATQERLQISGYIPLNHDSLRPEHRHGQNAIGHSPRPIDSHQIPFSFDIPMPPPLKTGVDYGFKKRT